MNSFSSADSRARSLARLERPADNRKVASPNLAGPTQALAFLREVHVSRLGAVRLRTAAAESTPSSPAMGDTCRARTTIRLGSVRRDGDCHRIFVRRFLVSSTPATILDRRRIRRSRDHPRQRFVVGATCQRRALFFYGVPRDPCREQLRGSIDAARREWIGCPDPNRTEHVWGFLGGPRRRREGE